MSFIQIYLFTPISLRFNCNTPRGTISSCLYPFYTVQGASLISVKSLDGFYPASQITTTGSCTHSQAIRERPQWWGSMIDANENKRDNRKKGEDIDVEGVYGE